MPPVDETPLILVSNRGPITFDRYASGEPTRERGGGGLVTALLGLLEHAPALWISAAITDEERVVAAEHGAEGFAMDEIGRATRGLLVDIDEDAYDLYYNIIANPMLWFIQHYLWDLSNHPDIRQEELDAWEQGLPGGQHRVRRRGHRPARRAPRRAGDAARLPPLHRSRAGARGPPGGVPALLRAHPLEPARLLAGAPATHPRGDRARAAGVRHRRASTPAATLATSCMPARTCSA